ncbi:MAG: PAS-domain containing protein [Pseudomonadota bacterium]|nr:PAS-domain containing protein [Pseudomonadota bacterium]
MSEAMERQNYFQKMLARLFSPALSGAERLRVSLFPTADAGDRLRDVAELAGDWIWEMNSSLRFVQLSGRFYEVTGLEPSEIIGKMRAEAVQADISQPNWQRHLDDLANHRPFHNFEYTLKAKDGTPRHMQISGKPILSRRGTFLGYIGTGRDRTPEVLARKALETSAKQFRDLIEGSIQGMFIHDDWDILFANQSLAEILGFSCHLQVLDLARVDNMISPVELERLKGYNRARREGRHAPASYEVRCRRANGSEVWCEFRTTPTMWHDKPAFLCAVVDISDRKSAETELKLQHEKLVRRDRELRDQNERFSAALANMTQGICLFDAEQRLIVSNSRYADIYGLTEEQLRPGTTLKQILKYRIDNGLFAGGSPEAYIEERLSWVSQGKTDVTTQRLSDGRTIEIRHQPMAGGGWLTTHEDISVRVQAEAELRKRDELFGKAFQACPALFAISTPTDGLIFDVNEIFLGTLGYTLEEVRGKTSLEIGLWAEPEQRKEFVRMVEEKGAVRDFQCKWLSKSGKEIQLLLAGEHVEVGGEARLFSVAQDITERSRATGILTATIENFPGGLSIFDANLSLLMANRQFYEMLAFPQEKLGIGSNLEAFFRYNAERGEYGEGDLDQQVRERLELARKFEPHLFERSRPDGSVLEVRGFPLPGGGFVTSYVDITERKLAEADLAKSQELFMKAFHAIPAMFAISDPATGKHYDVNDAWVANFGFSREEAQSKTVLELGIWEAPEERAHFVKLLASQGSVRGYESRMRTKDGRMLDVVIAGEYIKLRGEPRIFVVSQDVTHQKKAEAILRGQKEELQRRVDLATAELQIKAQALETALSREKQLNELQRQFVAMASHEFRTPLAVIDSSVQRLMRQKDKLTPEMLETRATRIRSAVQIMSELMESTLSAASMDAGRIRINVDKVNLRELLRAACRRQADIGDKHKFKLDLKGLPEIITADGNAIGQVFSNLLSNAVKYSPDNPEIRLKGWKDGDMVCVSVADHGLGIDAEDLPNMFNRFFRARTSSGIPGTGIGLNIVRMLVEMHDGTIEVTSKKGEGSCFTVKLPIAGPRREDAGEAGKDETRAA